MSTTQIELVQDKSTMLILSTAQSSCQLSWACPRHKVASRLGWACPSCKRSQVSLEVSWHLPLAAPANQLKVNGQFPMNTSYKRREMKKNKNLQRRLCKRWVKEEKAELEMKPRSKADFFFQEKVRSVSLTAWNQLITIFEIADKHHWLLLGNVGPENINYHHLWQRRQ